MWPARFFLTVLSVFFVPCLYAQEPLETVLRTLKPDQTVRIRIQEGDLAETTFLYMPADSLASLLYRSSPPLNPATIDSLWIKGRATATGAIVGGAVTGAAAFALLAALCEGFSEGTGCDEWDSVAAYSLLGAAGGGFIGAAIGSAIPKWRLRYARQLPVQVGLMIQRGHELAVWITLP